MMKCTNCGTEFEGNFCPNCGTPAHGRQMPQPLPHGAPPDAAPYVQAEQEPSRFTGGAFANFFVNLLTYLITLVTLSLAYPAMKCWQMRWEVRHTYINGRQLTFDGKARQLYGKYILWLFLSVITLGIYYLFCMSVNLVRWQTKHTHISGVEGGESKFTGGALGYFGTNFVCSLVTIVTLTLGMYWAKCHKERWLANHKIIDGYRIEFDGKALQYFGKRVVWTLLTIVTLLIYSFWLAVKSKKWITKHTVFIQGQLLPAIRNGSEAAPAKQGKNRDEQPKGPEYWGDLEDSFKTEQNKKLPGYLSVRKLWLASFIILLIMICFYICSVAIAGGTSSEGSAVGIVSVLFILNLILLAICCVISAVLFFKALDKAKDGSVKIGEDTTIGKLTRAMHMTVPLIVLSALIIVCTVVSGTGIDIAVLAIALLAINIAAVHNLKKLKQGASQYWLNRGVSKDDLKKQPLGEFYIKLDKYGEYLKYQEYQEEISKKNKRKRNK